MSPTETLPDWFGSTAVEYIKTVEDGVTVIRYPGGSRPMKWRSDCDYCLRLTKTDFAPSHQAASMCRSGARDHCTCDGCF